MIDIPLASLTIDSVASVAPSKGSPIICICRRGNSSQQAVQILKSFGYTYVKDIIGGMTAVSQLNPSIYEY
jgi:rhodanese-related sulfurtransferase